MKVVYQINSQSPIELGYAGISSLRLLIAPINSSCKFTFNALAGNEARKCFE
jgi:hypothetical protein